MKSKGERSMWGRGGKKRIEMREKEEGRKKRIRKTQRSHQSRETMTMVVIRSEKGKKGKKERQRKVKRSREKEDWRRNPPQGHGESKKTKTGKSSTKASIGSSQGKSRQASKQIRRENGCRHCRVEVDVEPEMFQVSPSCSRLFDYNPQASF